MASGRIPPVPAVLRLVQRAVLQRWRATEDDLYRECARRGLQEHEYVVRCIVPETPDEVDGTPLYPV